MSIFRNLVLAGCWLAASSSTVLASSLEAHPCNGCNELAFQTAAANRGLGIHYFYDFSSGQLKGYEVHRELDLMPGAIVFFPVEVPVPSEYLDHFDKMVQVRAEFGDLSKITVPVTVGPNDPVHGVSAYDVVSDSGPRNNVSNWLRSQANVLFERAGASANAAANLGSLLQSLDKIFTNGELLKVQVEVTLSDGSFVVFEFSKNNTIEGRPQYIAGSARDVNEQDIVEPGQNLPNGTRFSFGVDNSEDTIRRWLDHTCYIVACERPNGRVRGCVVAGGRITCTSI
ncbi:MAG: hypothetical protein MEQ07_05430 [Aquimonas sp.]|nr:hypothetical protein [Aquimonas sp.]